MTTLTAAQIAERIAPNGSESVHTMYAPLANPALRTTCCPACLKVWADLAYDEGADMPEDIRKLRSK